MLSTITLPPGQGREADVCCTVLQKKKEMKWLCLQEIEELAFDLDLKGDIGVCKLRKGRRNILNW